MVFETRQGNIHRPRTHSNWELYMKKETQSGMSTFYYPNSPTDPKNYVRPAKTSHVPYAKASSLSRRSEGSSWTLEWSGCDGCCCCCQQASHAMMRTFFERSRDGGEKIGRERRKRRIMLYRAQNSTETEKRGVKRGHRIRGYQARRKECEESWILSKREPYIEER